MTHEVGQYGATSSADASSSKFDSKIAELSPTTVDDVLYRTRGSCSFRYWAEIASGVTVASGTSGVGTIVGFFVPCVSAAWNLSNKEAAVLTAAVYAGQIIGALFFGVLGDSHGPRFGSVAAAILGTIFSFISVIATSLPWLVFARFVVGVAAGAVGNALTLLSEVLARQDRRRSLIKAQGFSAYGVVYACIAAWVTLSYGHSNGWRYLLLAAALVYLSSTGLMLRLPESPEWLESKGRRASAIDALRQIAAWNGITDTTFLLEGCDEAKEKKSSAISFGDLWRRRDLRRRLLVAYVVWFAFGFCACGTVLLVAQVLETGDGSCSFAYGVILFSSSSELVANWTAGFLTDRVQLRRIVGASFATAASGIFLLTLSSMSVFLMITAFWARGFVYVTNWYTQAITPMLFPVEVRATGQALSSIAASVGGIGASFVMSADLPYTVASWLLTIIAIVGGITSQAWPSNRDLDLADESATHDTDETQSLLHGTEETSHSPFADANTTRIWSI